MTRSLLLIAFALGGHLTQGERVGVHEATVDYEAAVETNLAFWGRSCESLESRFATRSADLEEMEGVRAFVGSLSLMRTLRRANARNCSWVTSGDVDMSAVAGVARKYLREAPCYNQTIAAAEAAQNLPEAERESALEDALVMLFSLDCETEVPEPPEDDDDSSEEAMEEEMDDAHDEIMDHLASSQALSLMQQEQNPIAWSVAGWEFMLTMSGSWGFIVAAILVGILMSNLCGFVMHTMARILRWIRCRIFGNMHSCDYYDDTWTFFFIQAGCRIVSLMFGPYGLIGGLNAAFGANIVMNGIVR